MAAVIAVAVGVHYGGHPTPPASVAGGSPAVSLPGSPGSVNPPGPGTGNGTGHTATGPGGPSSGPASNTAPGGKGTTVNTPATPAAAVQATALRGQISFFSTMYRFYKSPDADPQTAKTPQQAQLASLLNLAVAQIKLGQPVEATQSSDKALAINPKNAAAYNNRAICRFALGNRAGAVADWKNAVRLDPKTPGYTSNLDMAVPRR